MIVVSNTSPISNLAKVEQLSLMPQLYGRILIPCAVHEELWDSRAGETVITAVRSTLWIDLQSVQNQGVVRLETKDKPHPDVFREIPTDFEWLGAVENE